MYYDIDGKPIEMMEWARGLEGRRRIIGQAKVGYGQGKKWVSTIWLGLDHNYSRDGPPLIFETMVFIQGNSSLRRGRFFCHDIFQDRYSTKEDAYMCHLMLCRKYQCNRRQRRKRLQL